MKVWDGNPAYSPKDLVKVKNSPLIHVKSKAARLESLITRIAVGNHINVLSHTIRYRMEGIATYEFLHDLRLRPSRGLSAKYSATENDRMVPTKDFFQVHNLIEEGGNQHRTRAEE